MSPPPPEAELVDRALELQEALGAAAAVGGLPGTAIASPGEALSQVVAELRGEREPHIVLFRPESLVSCVRGNFESTLETTEGNDVYEFIRTLAYRAEALDLPRIVPTNE